MRITFVVAAVMALAAAPVSATTIADAAGDFLPTYVGPKNADLDVLSTSAERSGAGVRLSSVLSGALGTTPGGGLYIWGVNRGAGFPGLIASGPPAVGTPNMLMDAVVVVNPDGTGRVRTFVTGSAPVDTVLPAGSFVVAGSTIGGFVPFGLLPSTGFVAADYTYVHWTRSQLGSQEFIADLVPANGPFLASAVPEPGVWASLILGVGLAGALARRRVRPTAAAIP